MADRPILFSDPMVRALLEGRKTQTRRVLKPQPDPAAPIAGADFVVMEGDPGRWCWLNGFDGSIVAPFNVSARPSDRLWVREAWNAFTFSEDGETAWPTEVIPTAELMAEIRDAAHRHDTQAVHRESDRARKWFTGGPWRPAIHMPRWASRLTLSVTDVRVERVQEISEDDAKAEGPTQHSNWPDEYYASWTGAFRALWDSINSKREGCAWSDNPWVVALTFDVHHQNIDAMPAPSVDGRE
ncbi:hypothetical protein [Oceaniradius stylonematis]|uniref:hypothetical protein n=1 Tax=Oceaniradius stylonematis TaxID=2184161 RepID=UPI00273EF136|nr:hypothetical protein [Oceaniradius stylonematis]